MIDMAKKRTRAAKQRAERKRTTQLVKTETGSAKQSEATKPVRAKLTSASISTITQSHFRQDVLKTLGVTTILLLILAGLWFSGTV